MTDDKAAAPQQQLCLSPSIRRTSVALWHVDKLGIEATINQPYTAIAIDGKKAMKDFVKFALDANHLEMHELAEGGNHPNLNFSKAKEFPLQLHPLSELAISLPAPK